MCSRFFVNPQMEREIRGFFESWEERPEAAPGPGDIRPSQTSLVIGERTGKAGIFCCRWGLDMGRGGGLAINARSETALEKPLFSAHVERRRLAVPAAGFYEWDAEKQRSSFKPLKGACLYMAGFWARQEDGPRFCILTTEANASVKPVHGRMPLIFDRETALRWLLEPEAVRELLRARPEALLRETEYEQLKLFGP